MADETTTVSDLADLIAAWDLVSDLAFSDMVLWVPTWNDAGYIAVAQVRPSTASTAVPDDLVGTFLPRGRQAVFDQALAHGQFPGCAGQTGPPQPEQQPQTRHPHPSA